MRLRSPIALPPGFEEVRHGPARVWVRPPARSWVDAALASHGSLYAAARHEAGDRSRLHGRAPVFVVPPGDGRWAVRHYVRGGTIAPLLGDRFVDAGVPRPFREARASLRTERAGIATPRVVAAAMYRAGIFYRADLITEYIPESSDLGSLLFQHAGDRDTTFRREALERCGGLVRRLAAAGIRHPDLNVKNILMQRDEDGFRLYLVDLDRSREAGPGSADRLLRAMRQRLLRSIRKWEVATDRPLSSEERSALDRGFDPTC